MSQIMARTEEMRGKAQNILSWFKDHKASNEKMMNILKNMGPVFSGKLPSKMLQNVLSMKESYRALYQDAERHAGKIMDAANAYDEAERTTTNEVNALDNVSSTGSNGVSSENPQVATQNMGTGNVIYPVDCSKMPTDFERDTVGFDKYEKRVFTDFPNSTFEKKNIHGGLDFTGAEGMEIKASAPGKVIVSQNDPDGFGNYVMVEYKIDDKYYYATYAHLQNPGLPVGSEVVAGTVIGGMGKTGSSFVCASSQKHRLERILR